MALIGLATQMTSIDPNNRDAHKMLGLVLLFLDPRLQLDPAHVVRVDPCNTELCMADSVMVSVNVIGTDYSVVVWFPDDTHNTHMGSRVCCDICTNPLYLSIVRGEKSTHKYYVSSHLSLSDAVGLLGYLGTGGTSMIRYDALTRLTRQTHMCNDLEFYRADDQIYVYRVYNGTRDTMLGYIRPMYDLDDWAVGLLFVNLCGPPKQFFLHPTPRDCEKLVRFCTSL